MRNFKLKAEDACVSNTALAGSLRKDFLDQTTFYLNNVQVF